MNAKKLQDAAQLAGDGAYILIATALAGGGMPHIAIAGRLELCGEGGGGQWQVAVTEWFCPGTIGNLEENRNISLAVFDGGSGIGYQLLGQLERIEDMGVLNGYGPAVEQDHPMPQVERRLVVRVEKVLDLTPGPHSDVEDE